MSRLKVVYWNNIASPYVVGRFNAIADRGNLEFTGAFDSLSREGRSWLVNPEEWRFSSRILSSKDSIVDVTRSEEIDILVSLYFTRRFVEESLASRRSGTKVVFRLLPTFDAWQARSILRESIKHGIFRTVDAVKVPGDDGASVALDYGVSSDRIFEVTQSIDISLYGRALDIPLEIRSSERSRFGLHGVVFLYVGRLWRKKGIFDLLDAYAIVKKKCPETSLLLVGDGVDEKEVQEKARNIRDVVMAGFIQPSELPEWYALGDVFVFPTWGDPHGLVVEEAMIAGLPVISSTAAGDIQSRLPDGEAGFVVSTASVDELADRMVRLAVDKQLRQRMSMKGRSLALKRDHEAYAVDFERMAENVARLPARRNAVERLVMSGSALLGRRS